MTAAMLPLLLALAAPAADPSQVLPPNQPSADRRLGPLRVLEDKNFFFEPPATREAWEKRRQAVRERILVATGLWPLPPKTPLAAAIHGKIDRDDYTIEKVSFTSLPGHTVTGNLYRPKGRSGRLPGVLFAHGHWENGRLYAAPDKAVANDLANKGEGTPESARYPLQALPAQLARMGCVVFVYDMVGYADSLALTHRVGFTDAEAELRLQSFMGLQTWNSIRALDFLIGLPDVDPARVGMTGASGGGTQTFLLAAIDDRLAVAFPAVMVSTAYQGGCVCENCSLLRVGTGNVEMAAIFAPRPLAMTGAKDWTVDVERTALPSLRKLYKLYGAEDKVDAHCFEQFGHNYNQVSREVMYNWFNKYLKLGCESPVVEKPFRPVPPAELHVFDNDHPRPRDADAAALRRTLTETSQRQFDALIPQDAKGLAHYRQVVGSALRVMVDDDLPRAEDVEATPVGDRETIEGVTLQRLLLGRKGAGEQVPALGLAGPEFDGTVVVWIHPQGKASLFKDGKLTAAARKLLDGKAGILAVDVFGTGELSAGKVAVNDKFAGFTFGYNRSLAAQRVHDVLTAVAYARGHEKTRRVHLLGLDRAGPWVLLARGLCGDQVERTFADAGFRFDEVLKTDDEMLLSGALKYGGLPGLAALAAPGEVHVWRSRGPGWKEVLVPVYEKAGGKIFLEEGPMDDLDKVLGALLR